MVLGVQYIFWSQINTNILMFGLSDNMVHYKWENSNYTYIYTYMCVCMCIYVSAQHNLAKQPVWRKAMHFYLKPDCQRA